MKTGVTKSQREYSNVNIKTINMTTGSKDLITNEKSNACVTWVHEVLVEDGQFKRGWRSCVDVAVGCSVDILETE